jgi:tetratricopeptide (TPR) repeat protein
MSTLRLTQNVAGRDQYRVEAALEGDGLPRQTAVATFGFQLAAQDQEDIRWYLEDYLQYPQDPAPMIAARIEGRMAELGIQLFKDLFQSSDDARDLWATLRMRLNDTRVEIITQVREATAIPWELVRDPKTDTPLALRAQSFVRAHPQAAQRPHAPATPDGPIRILLVICRPGGDDDVPFRSVASRLIKGLCEDDRALFQLDVLRPPTFEELGRVLRDAKAQGKPYHVVHFDGHGTYCDATKVAESGGLSALLRGMNPLLLSGARPGGHGYLLFENPTLGENMQLVDGPALGKLLVETHVPVLVLNACQSAHAEAPVAPETTAPSGPDPHRQVRALGSLAQEVMDAGVAGVVAMRYNVYVVTAAQFVAELYAVLTQGLALGEAVTRGRKQLADQPLREIAYAPRPLQDWPVPVVYEALPIALFPSRPAVPKIAVTLSEALATSGRGKLDPKLPKRPDAGFFGRDETLLALDRAFDHQNVVLLHAYAGSGKTSTAAEFARWYALTGGVAGPVLFTSFEQYMPLTRVLDQIGTMFGDTLERAGIHWLTLDDAKRRDVALQVLKQIPVLWIWDNVEPVAGFPAGMPSAWSADEQRELVDFLRDARETKAKFLLTSRRDEQAWLGGLPRRIPVPAMPMQERVQLARALAEKHGHRLTDVADWRPLLRFTQGNPLTITVLVGQALREGLKTADQINAFVDRLQAGEAAFEDETSEGRSKSLGASLSYGFAQAFTEVERKQLALLHFFQGFVDVDALILMGNPETDWCLPELRGLTREAGIALLNRAAEIGLLTSHAGGYYGIHPALPWYFKTLFDAFYPAQVHRCDALRAPPSPAARAFVAAIGELGNSFNNKYKEGNSDVIAALSAEEANLLHARQLARTLGLWRPVVCAMQALDALYRHTGRNLEWARLVAEIVPDYVDSLTEGPLPGHEIAWSFVTQYRVRIAEESRRWLEAERLQRLCIERDRRRASAALSIPPEELDGPQRNAIRSLASSVHVFAEIQRNIGSEKCVLGYKLSLALAERIDDRAGAAICAYNLGNAYKNIPILRDLAQAEQWYRRSLEANEEHQRQDRAQCLCQLGTVARQRFVEAREAKRPKEGLLRHLNEALRYYQQALELLPPDDIHCLATTHNQLGIIYGEAGDLDRAMSHYRESIRITEASGNLYDAALIRLNVAIDLTQAGRFVDAREYARAALRNYETYGDRAVDQIQKSKKLLSKIEEHLQAQHQQA